MTADTRFDGDRLDRRVALAFLRSHVLGHLSLPHELAYFGTGSRAETRPLVEAIDHELMLQPEAKLDVWIGGEPTEWDFDGWPGLPLIEKWGIKGRKVSIVLEADTLQVLTFGQRLRILEHSHASLFSSDRLPAVGGGKLLAEVRGAHGAIAWASGEASARIPAEEWGRSTGAVVSGRAGKFTRAEAHPIRLSEFFRSEFSRGDLLRISN
jgi:DEAD/DEAH box helicase domain-containing protein